MSRKSIAPLLPSLAVLVFSAMPAAADPPRWTFMDLGALFNTVTAFFPYGVNDLGQVTGSGVQGFVQGGPEGPFITQPYSPVNWAPRPGSPGMFMDQVAKGTFANDPPNPSPDNTLNPAPFVINNLAGTTGRGYSYPHDMAFVGTRTLTTAIGTPGEVTTGYGINDAGHVVGVKAVSFYTHAIRIAGGVTTDLGTFRTLPPDGNNDRSEAHAVNASGVVVGFARNDTFVPGLGTNQSRAFKWTDGGGLVDLGTVGGPSSYAFDINNLGAVTGYSLDPGFSQVAVRWSPANAISVIPNGPQTFPNAGRWINDAGWIVGTAHIVPTGSGYFFHDGTTTYDLATLLDDDGTHWTNLVITDMNNAGDLVGYGTNDNTPFGGRRVFLLRPGGPTATTLALVEARATSDRVSLRWHASSSGLELSLERRREDEAWTHVASVHSDGSGRVEFEDAAVQPGRRYGYRLSLAGSSPPRTFGETWVEVPTGLSLALRGFHPNPSAGTPAVAFTLPAPGPARLELLDVLGRRVVEREWASLEGGAHTIALAGDRGLRPGVYVVRLSFAGRTVIARGVLTDR